MSEVDLLGGEGVNWQHSQEGGAGRFVQNPLCSARGSRAEVCTGVPVPPAPQPPSPLFPLAPPLSLPAVSSFLLRVAESYPLFMS